MAIAGARAPLATSTVARRWRSQASGSALHLDQTTQTHTQAHTPSTRAQGWRYSPRPASLRRLESHRALRPQPAHPGHHSPRRHCYKTWCGVCGSGGHACGAGMAPCPATAAGGGNAKTRSSPPRRTGSALHTGMCRCPDAPGTSSGRAGGHGFWTEISGAEAPFETGTAVSLHAPDCKTSSSSIGSSGTGLAQGSGIAYSDASSPRIRLRLGPTPHSERLFRFRLRPPPAAAPPLA